MLGLGLIRKLSSEILFGIVELLRPVKGGQGFPGESAVKNRLAMQESSVRSLAWEDPLEEGMATHSRVLASRIPRDRGPWQATVHGVAKSRTRLRR